MGIDFTFPDTCICPGDDAFLRVRVSDIPAEGLYAFRLYFTYPTSNIASVEQISGDPTDPWFGMLDDDPPGDVAYGLVSFNPSEFVHADGVFFGLKFFGVTATSVITVTGFDYALDGGDYIPYSLPSPTITVDSSYCPPEADWYIDIDIDACGTGEDINRLGQATDALDGFDLTFDEPEAPEPPGVFVRGYFPHPEWDEVPPELGPDFAHDIRTVRDLSTCPEIWKFRVETSGCPAGTLTFHFHDVPVEYDVWLIDLYRCGFVTEISDAEVYNFDFMGSHPADFLIIVGPLNCYQYLAGWNLISVPYVPPIPVDRTPDAIFGDDVDPFYIYGGYSCEELDHYVFPTIIDSFAGYWFGLLENAVVCVDGDEITARPIEKHLCPGWNLIGTPIPENILKDDIDFEPYGGGTVSHGFDEAVTNDLLYEPRLLGWYDCGYVESGYLNPWQGYWLNVESECIMRILTSRRRPSAETGFANIEAPEIVTCTYWRLNIRADNGTGAYDYLTTLGVSSDASDGFDGYDYAEPPHGMGNYVSIYFPHPEWGVPTGANFDYDIKSPLPCYTEKSWSFSIKSSDPNVILSWDPPPDLDCGCAPEDDIWTLHDIEGDVYIDMADISVPPPYSYLYTHIADVERHFIINSIPCNVETYNKPVFVFLGISPSPFNSACRISAPEGVIVEIFDINGRNIAKFGGGDQVWKPEASVGSGVYLVRAKIGDMDITKRVVYLK